MLGILFPIPRPVPQRSKPGSDVGLGNGENSLFHGEILSKVLGHEKILAGGCLNNPKHPNILLKAICFI